MQGTVLCEERQTIIVGPSVPSILTGPPLVSASAAVENYMQVYVHLPGSDRTPSPASWESLCFLLWPPLYHRSPCGLHSRAARAAEVLTLLEEKEPGMKALRPGGQLRKCSVCCSVGSNKIHLLVSQHNCSIAPYLGFLLPWSFLPTLLPLLSEIISKIKILAPKPSSQMRGQSQQWQWWMEMTIRSLFSLEETAIFVSFILPSNHSKSLRYKWIFPNLFWLI